MVKKYEIYNLGGGAPKELEKRLVVPRHIGSSKNLLNGFVDKEITPVGLDLILLEDMDGFLTGLIRRPIGCLSTHHGMYVNSDPVWVPKEHNKRMREALRGEYDIEVQRAIFLPKKQKIDYWTVIHELLHDVFNNLPSDKRNKIHKSALATYVGQDSLSCALNVSKLEISSFNWDQKEMHRMVDENNDKGVDPATGFDSFYSLKNLKRSDQLRLIDEFIACFYTGFAYPEKFNEDYFPAQFRNTLQEVGYNTVNPPEIRIY